MRARSPWVVDAVAVALLGLVIRLGLVLSSSGGFSGVFGYDPGVYFDGAVSLVNGRAPYRDFVLLHPPGVLVALAPFGALARLVGDHAAFETANIGFAALGALCGAVVVGVARRAGLSRPAGLAGGLFYAVWFSSASSEIAVRLEPLGNATFLIGLLLLSGRGAERRRTLIAGGLALGYAADVKIWWIVPVAVVVAWQFRRRGRQAGAWVAAGAAAALVAVNAPFFAVAPGQMWRMVVTDQLGRNGSMSSRPTRLTSLSAVSSALRGAPGLLQSIVVALFVVLVAVVAVCAWRRRAYRIAVVIALVQLGTLAAAPSYFAFYADFAAVGLALTLAAAVGPRIQDDSPATARTASVAGADRPGRRRVGPLAAASTVLLVAAISASAMVVRHRGLTRRFDANGVAADLRAARCVVSDSPAALIELNLLSRNLARGCPDWVDVTGRTYDVDAPDDNGPARRTKNAKWQRDALRYLTSGDAVLLIRHATGLSGQTRREIRRRGKLIASGHGFRAYLMRSPG
ncbi:glycosyltransferase 87 family protein [uncultured Jatrophihabitans sp.]|uniref:glycosyltransferase 87 family protein n=1 Tax=uncultured Jatrophihabitans sp. TaxID=1610747 RepID=UPI0035CC0CAE